MTAATAATEKTKGQAPQKAATPATEAKKRFVQQLELTRFKGAEFARADFVAIAHANTQPEDLLAPGYWAHVASHLRPRAHVEVWADDGTWYAEVLVLEVGRAYARTYLKEQITFDTRNSAEALTIEIGGYRVLYRGEFARWSVVRVADNAVVREELGSQGEAVDWVNERIKADR